MARLPIPQEVVDQIIDCLWTDPVALKACALTCRPWVYASQRALFRSVLLHSNADLFKLLVILFESQHLARYTEVLHVHGPDPAQLPPLLRVLSAVRTIDLIHFNFTRGENANDVDGDAQHPLHLLSGLPQLEELRLADCLFGGYSDFLFLLRSIPGLKSLQMHLIVFFKYQGTEILHSGTDTDIPVAIERLSLSGLPYYTRTNDFPANHAFLEGIELRAIRSLVLAGDRPSTWLVYRDICERIGPSLGHIALVATDHQLVPHVFTLAHNVSLRTLRVDHVNISTPVGAAAARFWLADLLESAHGAVTAGALVSVEYHLRLASLRDFRATNGARIGRVQERAMRDRPASASPLNISWYISADAPHGREEAERLVTAAREYVTKQFGLVIRPWRRPRRGLFWRS